MEVMAAAFKEHGCMILDRSGDAEFSSTLLPAMQEQLAELLAAKRIDAEDDFYPGKTKRVLGLVNRMDTVRPFVLEQWNLGLANAMLGESCEKITLHLANALTPGPGSRQQALHRDDEVYSHLKVMFRRGKMPMPNLMINSMTALCDFEAENGATLVVPGSHLWDPERLPKSEEIVAAKMPAGATVYWVGGLLHGAGPNSTADVWRASVAIGYTCGWLRQEENQLLQVPPKVADTLSIELRSLLGYSMHDQGLGYYEKRLAESKYAHWQNNPEKEKAKL